METEIEKKWLVADDKPPADITKYASHKISQAYFSPDARVRVEQVGEDMSAVICIKQRTSELTAHEFIFDIPVADAIDVMKAMDVIEKVRYDIGNGFTLDVFKRELEGLLLIEKEYESEQQAMAEESPPAEWTVLDVTGLPQFINANLADKRFDRVDGIQPRLDTENLVLLEGNEDQYDIQ